MYDSNGLAKLKHSTAQTGSPWATISLCGDVIGPAFQDGEPVTLERLFPTGHGRFGKGTEYHIFNLAANTWQLHYFRLTNQLQERYSVMS